MNRHFYLILLLSIFYINSANSSICRVASNGQSHNDGSNWSNTMDLHSALQNQSCDEIWVKNGIYKPSTNANQNSAFTITRELKVYGGFNGYETALNQRTVAYDKAVLSGNIGNVEDAGDNSFHVVKIISTHNKITNNTIIDGLTIRDGYGYDVPVRTNIPGGGGLLCVADGANAECSPSLRNMDFRDNIAISGGAAAFIAVRGGVSKPIIENSVFTNNKAHSYLDSNEWAYSLGSGGAVYVQSGHVDDQHNSLKSFTFPTFKNTTFSDNEASNRGGAVNIFGRFGFDTAHFDSTTFNNNWSDQLGGAISTIVSGDLTADLNDTRPLTLTNSTLIENVSNFNRGGAISDAASQGGVKTINSTFFGNSSHQPGNHIWTDYALESKNTIFWRSESGTDISSNFINVQKTLISGGCSSIDALNLDTTICNSLITDDPKLSSLMDNGGFTETMKPQLGSPTLNIGDNSSCTAKDQRGLTRPQFSTCDLGAVEVKNTAVCMVTTTGTNQGDGSNWSNQAMTLTAALSTPDCEEIWVKKGTYYPTSGTDRTISFTILPNTRLLGGFSGNENDPNDRDINANPVILSGDIGATGLQTDNSYHVVTLNGTQGQPILPDTTLSDLIIQDGYTSTGTLDFPNNSGAGLFCDGSGNGNECSPSLHNVEFRNNQALAGGAIYNDASNNGKTRSQLANVTFINNHANSGGAIFNNADQGGDNSPQIIFSSFNNNTASGNGGAIVNSSTNGFTNIYIGSSSFNQNQAAYGGAIYGTARDGGNSQLVSENNQFSSNQAQQNGGAIYSAGWNGGRSFATISDSEFSNNSASNGGALFLNDLSGLGTAEINNSTFDQNVASQGGAIFNDGENGNSHPQLTNITFHNNFALTNGGAIYNNGNNGSSSPTLLNITFSHNQAQRGGAVYSSAEPSGVSAATYTNVIMWDNTASSEGSNIYHNLAESVISHSVIENGCPTSGFGNAHCVQIINQNPQLGALSNHGGRTLTMKPSSQSVAIDSGNMSLCPQTDQRSQPRPQGNGCDIGSFETSYSASYFNVNTQVVSGQGTISPTTQVVNAGDTAQFTISPDSGWEILSVSGCNGSLNGQTYTTGAINNSCTVTANFGQISYAVYATIGNGQGTVSPTTQVVNAGDTAQFSISPDSGWEILSVSGCNGSLNGQTYTTGAINSSCTVTANFGQSVFTVTTNILSGQGTVTPTVQQVNAGSTTQFNIAPHPDWRIGSVNGCGGQLNGHIYTTASIQSNCQIEIEFIDRICRVTTFGVDSNTGSDWQNTATTLPSALSTDTCDEIWVSGYGPAYTPGSLRSDSFIINRDVKIYGGFYGTETSLNQRTLDPYLRNSILSGDIDNDGSLSGNSYHVLQIDGQTANNVVIDGFTIAYGNADGNNWPNNSGGGIFCDGANASTNACSPTIQNVTFLNNNAIFGGGIYFDASYNGQSSANLSYLTFDSNTAESGGAIYINAQSNGVSYISIYNATFYNNLAMNNGAAMYVDASQDGLANPNINHTTIYNNNAGNLGGGFYLDASLAGTSSLELKNSILWGNASTDNKQIINIQNSHPIIQYSILEHSGAPLNWDSSLGTNLRNNHDINPGLRDFDYHGGFTKNMLIGNNGPALDGGLYEPGNMIDQRYSQRPIDGNDDGLVLVDIGSVETSQVEADIIFKDGFDIE